MGVDSAGARLAYARLRAAEPSGWRLVASRGYVLDAPPKFARDWIIEHLPFQSRPASDGGDSGIRVVSRGPVPAAITRFERTGLERYTEWDLSAQDLIAALDSVWKGSRLLMLSRSNTRFMGDENGAMLELTIYQKPVSVGSRLGLLLFPTLADPSRTTEATIYKAIDRDYSARHLRES